MKGMVPSENCCLCKVCENYFLLFVLYVSFFSICNLAGKDGSSAFLYPSNTRLHWESLNLEFANLFRNSYNYNLSYVLNMSS